MTQRSLIQVKLCQFNHLLQLDTSSLRIKGNLVGKLVWQFFDDFTIP